MRGVVFSQFLERVEARFGLDMVETLIEKTQPASGGVYTAVGSYPYEELHAMILELSDQTQIPAEILIEKFAMHIFDNYVNTYPDIVKNYQSSMAFIKDFEKNIQFEIQKLYTDESVPSFKYEERPGELTLHYESVHPLVHFAKGLIEATFRYFNDACFIKKSTFSDDWKQGTFIIAS